MDNRIRQPRDWGTRHATSGACKADRGFERQGYFPGNATKISGYLQIWGSVNLEYKRQVAGGMIYPIRASSDSVSAEWRIRRACCPSDT